MATEFISINHIDFTIINENPSSDYKEDSSSEEMLDDEKINSIIYNVFNYKSLEFDEDNINWDDLYIYSNKKCSVEKKNNLYVVRK